MRTKVSAAAFAAFLKERLAAKDGYILCATGQDPKTLSSWWFSGQYSGKQLEKALYWKEHAQRVWDCNGLAEGYYRDMTGVDVNTRCRYNYSDWCDPRGSGVIPAGYRMPGAAVFKKGSYIHHVGFLVEPVDADRPDGDWYVIEARGVMYGVVRTKLLSGGWTHWGLMTRYFEYAEPDSGNGSCALGDRLLKKGCRGEDVAQLQQIMIDMGYDLPKYGADGDFGAETEAALKKLQAALDVEVDGKYGDESHAALMARLEMDAAEENEEDAAGEAQAVRIRVSAAVSAYVRSGPAKSCSVVSVARGGMEFDSAAIAENGWRMVEINGKTGWISPKMYVEIQQAAGA